LGLQPEKQEACRWRILLKLHVLSVEMSETGQPRGAPADGWLTQPRRAAAAPVPFAATRAGRNAKAAGTLSDSGRRALRCGWRRHGCPRESALPFAFGYLPFFLAASIW
jgi:hypothetical protein